MNLEKINLHFQTHLFSKDVETEQVGEVVNMITMMVFQEQTEGATKQTIDGWFAHWGAMKQTIDGLHIEGIRKRVPDEVLFVYRKVNPKNILKNC